MAQEQLDTDMQRNEHMLATLNKTSKWITDQNAKHETIQLTEENIGENFCDLGLSKEFLDMMSKAQSKKERKLIKQTTSALKTFAL